MFVFVFVCVCVCVCVCVSLCICLCIFQAWNAARENFILLELLLSSPGPTPRPPPPSSKLANKNVNLELTKEFTSLVIPPHQTVSQNKYSCRVLSYNDHYFVLVNLKLDVGGGREMPGRRIKLPSRTCVAKCVVAEGAGEEQICINMTACVDLSVRQERLGKTWFCK